MPPREVLALGKHLVHELGFAEGVDTLGRWMSHHVAELIYAAEHGATEDARREAEQTATETILKIWDHREVLPGRAFPLRDYEEVFRMLEALRSGGASIWQLQSGVHESPVRLATEIAMDADRLPLAAACMALPDLDQPLSMDSAAVQALSAVERRTLDALQRWSQLLGQTAVWEEGNGEAPASKREARHTAAEPTLKTLILRLIDRSALNLAKLRLRIEGPAPLEGEKMTGQPSERDLETVAALESVAQQITPIKSFPYEDDHLHSRVVPDLLGKALDALDEARKLLLRQD